MRYLIIGGFKFITFGGLFVWALIDWLRIMYGTFPDGHGMPLFNDTNISLPFL